MWQFLWAITVITYNGNDEARVKLDTLYPSFQTCFADAMEMSKANTERDAPPVVLRCYVQEVRR